MLLHKTWSHGILCYVIVLLQETVMASSLSHSLRVKVCALHRIPVVEYRRYMYMYTYKCIWCEKLIREILAYNTNIHIPTCV